MNDVPSGRITGDRGVGADGGQYGTHVRLRGGILGVLGISREGQKSDRRENRQDGNDDDELGERESGKLLRSGGAEDFANTGRNRVGKRNVRGVFKVAHVRLENEIWGRT